MFTISGIHVIHIHELKKVMAIKPPSLWAFQVLQISQLSTMTNWISFCYTPSQQASRDCIAWQPLNTWPMSTTAYVHQKRRHTTEDRPSLVPWSVVIPSVDASKVYFVASQLTQYWLACKLTCTKRNFDNWYTPISDRHNSRYRDTLTACIWLGLVLTTGRSSITTFVLTWTGDCVCGHLLSSNLTLDLRWNCHVVVTTMLYLLHMTCFELRTLFGTRRVRVYEHMHTEDRKHLWLFIVAAHDFPSTIFCIHNVHDKLYCSMNNYRWKCRHFRNVLYKCHSIKVNRWS